MRQLQSGGGGRGEGDPAHAARAPRLFELADPDAGPVGPTDLLDRWRLDQLLAWEEKRMEMAEVTLVAPERVPLAITDLLPQPKRRRRSA